VALHWGSHPGASDLFAPRGTPVVAMRGGEVVSVGTEATDQYGGNNVLIQGDDGLTYYYRARGPRATG
jgi:murein DD-endopeptidase MepM/ murein hydrolase activator NlpD